MPMRVCSSKTNLDGVLTISTDRITDDRGFFTECYSQNMWKDIGLDVNFVQDNMSQSRRGVVRGMHYQLEPYGMGKLIRAIVGSIFDVAVDLRKGSPTFGHWFGCILSSNNNVALWIPSGFAHGFLALSQINIVYYKSTCVHTPEMERSLSFNDPTVNITWPFSPEVVSIKDIDAPSLDKIDCNFVYKGT